MYDPLAGDPYGVIRDDDNPAPDLVVDCLDTDETDPYMAHGEPRTTAVICWVSTSHPTDTLVTFDYRTADGTAMGGDNWYSSGPTT